MVKPRYLTTQAIWASIVGLVVGVVIVLGIRFFTYKPESVHYHANFQVFVNNQREQFADPMLYEESGAACSEEKQMTPMERAHMHDNINDVVHVEDHAVTWGQFFTNLGWVVDAKVIETPSQVLLPDNDHKISFILNGQTMDNISNRVISDQDKLLVDYGDSGQAVKQQYANIVNKALKYDTSSDPKSCGSHATITWRQRLAHLF